ncbi:EamA family transporter [Nocardiopsis gilva YIM 90087]|uniref:EamA family transporter n=1 Tax=Nocardiopsis gilva YIM 90087 TaxID=1235441 RepID=A0A223S230_9ACTN|nr:EamA family transporter [Nocardiopsis gilva]ASU82168.1 EamA family transporter [Nocardiopsis gilva YIM 90087]
MSPAILAAVLGAALLHAAWNAIAHAITDRLLGFALIGASGMVCGGALAVATGPPAPEVWPLLLGSALVHVVYMSLLMLSYRTGEFGQVYPLARGTAPWVVALAATVVIGEALPPVHLAGVLVISAGLMALVFAGGRPRPGQAPALVAAVATGLAIAAYTVLDGSGARLSGDPVGYLAWLMLLQGPVFMIVAVITRRGRLVEQLRPIWRVGALGGALSAGAYGLVLWAQTQGALASVAALRETSIVFGAIIGAIAFKESFGHVRSISAIAVVTGIVLLAL